MSFMIRSGIEILATHPRLYWNDHCKPGSEWARFTKKVMPKDKLYDSLDMEEDYSPIVSMPGHGQLGLGRHWHFISVFGWILTGLSYVVILFATGQYHRYIPYSWEVFPMAWQNMVTYLSFELPQTLPGQPFNALQQLAYGSAIFVLAPFQILTGLFQGPAIEARFPQLLQLMGGRQWVRSLHFFSLIAWIEFIIGHLLMVVVHNFGMETAKVIFGEVRDPGYATGIALDAIVGLVITHIVATEYTLKYPRRTFEVGEALYLGFFFLDEEHGTYMVALSCEKPDCARTGIRLHESEFLSG